MVWPSGPTSRKAVLLRNVWLTPLRVTVAFSTLPKRPATLMTAGEGLAGSVSLIVIAAELEKVVATPGVTMRVALPVDGSKLASPA